MIKKNSDPIRSEKEIPEEVMEKLMQNRQRILNHEVKQEVRRNYTKPILFTVLTAAAFLILIANPQINSAIRNALGISKDPGVATIEDNGIENNLNLVSESNGMEITVTKFVTTKRKMAFDYQFKIDEKLKTLLEKNNKTEDPWAKTFEFIDVELYVNGGTESVYGGVSGMGYSYVEGDTYYGSLVSTFNNDTIPENAKLTLQITRLAWQDKEEVATEMAKAMADPDPMASFTVDNAVEYEGDWSFDIEYAPLTQTATPKISNVDNLTDIKANSDALQTTVTFVSPYSELEDNSSPAITIYKDGVATEGLLSSMIFDPTTGEFETAFGLSALDKSSVYKLQLNKVDSNGEPIEEIGSFELRNE